MNINSKSEIRNPNSETNPRHLVTSRSGFNMVEIAICLAIIGIALVAIVGVMPTGMRAGQDNREETIIDQDGRYFMQAIRLGRPGDGSFASFVESVNGQAPNNVDDVIGGLSLPTLGLTRSNVAIVRGLSGSAAEKGNNPDVKAVAFRYLLTTRVEPFAGAPGSAAEITNYLHEVRLRFDWPLRPDGSLGSRGGSGSPKVFRMLVSGPLLETNNLAFFRP